MDTNVTNNKKSNIIYADLCYKIYGCCFSVHNEQGRFKSERQYADALAVKFKEQGLAYIREKSLSPSFAGEENRRNIPDFLVESKIIIDLKAKRIVSKEDYYQMQRYLKSANKKLGLIVNFRQKYLSPKRIAN